MKHRLFLTASTLSLMLCGLTIFTCVRTYSNVYTLKYTRCLGDIETGKLHIGCGADRIVSVTVFHDKARFVWHKEDAVNNAKLTPAGDDAGRFSHGDGELPDDWFLEESWWNRHGLECSYWNHEEDGWQRRGLLIGGPLWIAAVLTGILPLMILQMGWRRLRRQRRHLCLACGYDLRATPKRCPECGKTAEARQ